MQLTLPALLGLHSLKAAASDALPGAVNGDVPMLESGIVVPSYEAGTASEVTSLLQTLEAAALTNESFREWLYAADPGDLGVGLN